MADKEVTLANFYDEYHSLVEEGLVSNAVAAYERAWRLRVNPSLSSRPLAELTALAISRARAAWSGSASTKQDALALLSRLLGLAAMGGLIGSNPCRSLPVRDRWDSAEYFIVREWQDRGVLHVHALVRIDRVEAPSSGQLRVAARSAIAFSKIDGALVKWGAQSQCDVFRADGAGAKSIWYLSKALNYVMKDAVRQGKDVHPQVWAHVFALNRAARSIRCAPDCDPASCNGRVHHRYGAARSQVVSASRRTRNRTGWSFTGLTRTVQRRLRQEWMEAHLAASTAAASESSEASSVEVVEDRALRLRRELAPCSAAVL